MCRKKLTQDKQLASDAFPLGEHAHIIGEKESSPRGQSILNEKEREAYPNRILLCPTDHTVVDKDVDAWPIEKLHQLKAEHELYVEQALTNDRSLRDQADDLIYSAVIDAAMEDLGLESLSSWASMVLEPHWRWSGELIRGIESFRLMVFRTDWPGRYPALEVALDRASFELQEAVVMFSEYAEPDGDDYVGKKRFKEVLHEPDVYHRLYARFNRWSQIVEERILEATKALNWAREEWRREVNPMWLASTGIFVISMWPDFTLRSSHVKPLYTNEEKAQLLTLGIGQGDIRPTTIKLDEAADGGG
jgi:hypothetical protein